MKHHDVALIFFAGHGHNDKDGGFCMLAVDMKADKLAETAVTGDELKNRLAELPAARVLLVLDACHSGAKRNNILLARRNRVASALTDDVVRELVDDDSGVVVMCAAMGNEESREAGGHGTFTQALPARHSRRPLERVGGHDDLSP